MASPSKIRDALSHVKTYLIELEADVVKLEGGTKSSSAKARAHCQKIRNLMVEMRKNIQDTANEIATKPRAKKVAEDESEDKENIEPTNSVAIIAESMEENPIPEPLPIKTLQTPIFETPTIKPKAPRKVRKANKPKPDKM